MELPAHPLQGHCPCLRGWAQQAGSSAHRSWLDPGALKAGMVTEAHLRHCCLVLAIWGLSGASAQSSLVLPQGASPDGLGSSHLSGWIPGDNVPRAKVEAEDLGAQPWNLLSVLLSHLTGQRMEPAQIQRKGKRPHLSTQFSHLQPITLICQEVLSVLHPKNIIHCNTLLFFTKSTSALIQIPAISGVDIAVASEPSAASLLSSSMVPRAHSGERLGTLLNSFNEASITPMPKPDEDTRRFFLRISLCSHCSSALACRLVYP